MQPTIGSFPFPDEKGTTWLAFTDYGPREGARTLICVHGLTGHSRQFDALGAALARDYHVIAFDLAGRGRSGWLADKTGYRLATYARHIKGLLAYRGLDTVDWLGIGIGGWLGLVLAAEEESPIEHLILNDSVPRMEPSGAARIAEYASSAPSFRTMNEAGAYLRAIWAPFGDLDDAEWSALTVHSLMRQDAGGYVLHYDPAIGEQFRANDQEVDLWAVYDRVRQPTLLLRGADSDVSTAATAAAMAARGPCAEVIEFAGCGHAPALIGADQIAAVHGWMKRFDPDPEPDPEGPAEDIAP